MAHDRGLWRDFFNFGMDIRVQYNEWNFSPRWTCISFLRTVLCEVSWMGGYLHTYWIYNSFLQRVNQILDSFFYTILGRTKWNTIWNYFALWRHLVKLLAVGRSTVNSRTRQGTGIKLFITYAGCHMYYVLWSYVTKVNGTLQAAVVTALKYILRQSLARNILLHVSHLTRLLGRDNFFKSGFL
jgi:hypothetical protein